MSTVEPQTEKTTCASCGSEMARSARLCHVCGSDIKQWKNSLSYFARIAGAIAIVASGAAFMAGQAAIWYDRLMWQDAVKVVFFEYPGVSGFLNTGSGDVVLESVMIERSGERNSITIPVNLLVHKGEFVPFDAKSPFGAPKNDNAGVWAASPDGAATPKLLSQANDWGNENRCASFPQRRSRRIPADHRAEAAKQAHHRGRIGALELHLAAHRPAKLAGGAALPDSVPVFPQQPGLRKRGLKSLQSSATGKVLTGGEAGSSPALSAYRLTILAALLGARASSETFPPSATARNNGPMLISAVASHVWTASTGRRQSHAGWPPLALPGPSCCGGSVHAGFRRLR